MEEIQFIMSIPITIKVIDDHVTKRDIQDIFDYFIRVDERFSTYKPNSEISHINAGALKPVQYSVDMDEVLALSEETRKVTHGYFDISHKGKLDPSGLVKGWAINNASNLLKQKGFEIFYIDAGGDIQAEGKLWNIGIRHPFNEKGIVKVLSVMNHGVATSGTYNRGQHVYNPHKIDEKNQEIVSLTVIGPNIYEADRFATAAFAMGNRGIQFIEKLAGFEAYMIDAKGIATLTSSFEQYVSTN
ncbi:FAD:protein FMN transferase [soil metagenome]